MFEIYFLSTNETKICQSTDEILSVIHSFIKNFSVANRMKKICLLMEQNEEYMNEKYGVKIKKH